MLCGSSLTEKTLFQVMIALQIIGWGMFPLIASGQEILPPKQPIESLEKAQTIYLQAKITKGGIPIDPQLTTNLIIQRFQKIGYKTVLNHEAPHDVTENSNV